MKTEAFLLMACLITFMFGVAFGILFNQQYGADNAQEPDTTLICLAPEQRDEMLETVLESLRAQ